MFQKIITCNDLTLQLSCLFISLDVCFLLQRFPLPSLRSLPSPKSRRPSLRWSWRAFLPLRLSCTTVICHHTGWEKKWQKKHTEVTDSWSKILFIFSEKRSKLYKTRYFKAQIVHTCRKNERLYKQDLWSQFNLLENLVFNKSLQSEVIQMTTEAANIIPVFKNRGGTYLVNYWAISLAQTLW